MAQKTVLTVVVGTVVGVVFSIIIGLVGATIIAVLPLDGSCKTPGMLGAMLFAPLGSAIGISLVDGIINGFRRFSVVGFVLAFVIYGIGMFLSLGSLGGNVQFVVCAAALTLVSAIVYHRFAARKKLK